MKMMCDLSEGYNRVDKKTVFGGVYCPHRDRIKVSLYKRSSVQGSIL
jgi:hypothetical protein